MNGIGQWQKILQRSKLTGIDLENATMVLNEAAKRNFQAAMGRSGVVSDYVSARMDCAGDAHDGIMAKAEKDPEQKKQVVTHRLNFSKKKITSIIL